MCRTRRPLVGPTGLDEEIPQAVEVIPGTVRVLAEPSKKTRFARLESGDFDGAVRDFSGAQSIWPGFAEAGLLLGIAYHKKGNDEQAERVFHEMNSSSTEKARDQLTLWIAAAYAGLGATEQAS